MTPIRDALLKSSVLQSRVDDGLGALKKEHKNLIEPAIRARFADSIDIDAAFREAHPSENRWDYLLGDGTGKRVVALEPHSAKSDEVSTVIAKKQQAVVHLREHLKPGRGVARWFWVASGSVQFPSTDAVNLRLASHNITFVGRQLRKRDVAA